MPSPFPGMDPYLEPHWLDIHGALIAETRRELNRRLPDGLFARIEERVAIEPEVEDRPPNRVGPDVRVVEQIPPFGSLLAATAVTPAPFRLIPADDPVVERFLRVEDAGGRLVTVVEFVSPSNKRGDGLRQFRRNRRRLLASGIHFVEIDLVRAGNWRRLMRPERCPPRAASLYRATVREAGDDGGDLYPIMLRQPLPDVAIPLRRGDGAVVLPLQPLLAGAYDDGRYGRTVDYDVPPDPPLEPDDAAWATALLAGRSH